MNAEDKANLLGILNSSREEFIGSLSGVTQDLAVRRPEAGRWSVLDCVEHVAVVEDILLKQVTSAKHSDDAVANVKREAIIVQRAGNRQKRVEAPDPARPIGRFANVEAALDHFLASRRQVISFVENLNDDPRRLLSFHLVIGPVNVYENLLMLALHPRRHAGQIEETRRRLAGADH